jgi:hypothetical protein
VPSPQHERTRSSNRSTTITFPNSRNAPNAARTATPPGLDRSRETTRETGLDTDVPAPRPIPVAPDVSPPVARATEEPVMPATQASQHNCPRAHSPAFHARDLRHFARRSAPWLSLILGLGSAFWMDRSPQRAPLFAAAAVFAAPSLMLLRHAARHREGSRSGTILAWLGVASAQSLAQAALLFALPLHVASADPTIGQAVYLLCALTTALVTLWDPLWSAIAARPWAVALHLGIAATVALQATLPFLGLGSERALAVGAGMGTLAAWASLFGAGGWRIPARYTVAQLVALPLLLSGGPLAAMVPASPLRLGEAVLARAVEDRTPVGRVAQGALPARVACFTPILGPAGVHEALRHVWLVDGAVVQRTLLPVRTGRRHGFRTWSYFRTARVPAGADLRCRVETAAGQRLGEVAPLATPAP